MNVSREESWPCIQSFLKENDADENYKFFEEQELNDWLSKFWFSDCTNDKENPEYYQVNPLKSFKYGLNHIWRRSSRIHHNNKCIYPRAMTAFDNAYKELKQMGKGAVKNHEEIDDEGNYIFFNQFLIKNPQN